MATIKKDILHPENEPDTNIYPKTSIDQVENLQANLDAINGDISNVNGEIAALSTNVSDITTRVSTSERNIIDLQNDVNQNIIDISDIKSDITTLNTAYDYFTDYTIVNNVLKLQYRSGYEFELPLKAGTNVTFSKYPGSNYLIINSAGGTLPTNIAYTDANNKFIGANTFESDIQINPEDGNFCNIAYDSIYWSVSNILAGFTWDSIDFHLIMNENDLIFPKKSGTIATLSDIPSTSSFPTLTGNNTWSGKNIFNNGITTGITKYADYITYHQYIFNFPNKNGTLALVEDIPNTSSFATLAGNNKWTGDNIFDGFSKSIRVNGLFQVSGDEELISATYNQVSYDGFNIAYMVGENQNIFHVGIDFENKARFGFDKYDGSSYNLYIPEKDGTLATVEDIPTTTYTISQLNGTSVEFPFDINKNHFFTITMSNNGDSKSFIYARGTSSTYTININEVSFEVKLDVTSTPKIVITNKTNTDPFVVRAEISN